MSKLTRILMGCIAAGALSVSAHAADLPMKAAPMAPMAPAWNWSGFYFGANVGAGWGTTETNLSSVSIPAIPLTIPIGLPLSQNSMSGILGGVQAGYNWQAGWAVLGIEGTISGADIKGTTPCVVILSCTEKTNWLATASARLGAVVLDRGLVYVKGGAAWQNTRTEMALPGILAGLVGVNDVVNGTHTNVGWLVGMGTEWAITKNWTAFVEYDYMNFQKKTDAFPIVPLPIIALNLDVKSTLSVAKVGVNYKFDWAGPVVAKY